MLENRQSILLSVSVSVFSEKIGMGVRELHREDLSCIETVPSNELIPLGT